MDHLLAIRKTIIYASFFDFPLFPTDIHYWLITSKRVSFSKIKSYLPTLSIEDKEKRNQLESHTLNKIQQAESLARFLSYTPFLRFMGITGSVAARNAKAEDDIDLMIVTAPHTLWLVRPVVLLIIRLFFRLRRPHDTLPHTANAFCPNLWLDTLFLAVPVSNRNLYIAHEVLQVYPILDKNNTHQLFLQANSWASQFLSNAYHAKTQSYTNSSGLSLRDSYSNQSNLKHIHLEDSMFSLLSPFNYFFYLLQLLYMSSKRTSEVVHLHGAFLHTINFSHKINQFFKRNLKI